MDEKDKKIELKYEGTAYSTKYDAYFKIETGAWLEPICSDPECDVCDGRPTNYYELFDESEIPKMKVELLKNNYNRSN